MLPVYIQWLMTCILLSYKVKLSFECSLSWTVSSNITFELLHPQQILIPPPSMLLMWRGAVSLFFVQWLACTLKKKEITVTGDNEVHNYMADKAGYVHFHVCSHGEVSQLQRMQGGGVIPAWCRQQSKHSFLFMFLFKYLDLKSQCSEISLPTRTLYRVPKHPYLYMD